MNISIIHELFLSSTGVCTDTRKLKKNQLFFALKGDNFDGNLYAKKALDMGASHVIIDDPKFYTKDDISHILVNNVLEALQKLATFHRKHLNIPVIALTGSNGKTTTKELIAAVLSQSFRISATKGNLNNHIGVPLTLLEMNADTEIGIVEMGANHQKEIEFLCSIVLPDYGYITNIGKAHLEGFGGIEGVLKGKTELYQHLRKHHKLIFLNKDDVKLHEAAMNLNTFCFSTTKKNSDLTIEQIQTTKSPYVAALTDTTTIYSNLIGSYNFVNIACAIAMGIYFKVPLEKIKKGIESYTPSNNRSQLIKKEHQTIIMDAYNANPSSMMVALDNFNSMSFKNKLIILGDMFELGDDSTKEHEFISQYALQTNAKHIFLIGDHFFKTSIQNKAVTKILTTKEAVTHFKAIHQHYDGVLVKGSRGMQLENLIQT